jgi:hypothetical protein
MKSLNLLFIFSVVFAAIFSFGSCKPILCCSNFNDTTLATGKGCRACSDSIYASCMFTIRAAKLDLDGVGYFDYARGENAPIFWGDGNVLKTNKATLHFINTGTVLPVKITFDYLDMSGINNLSVNGILYSGELSAVPANLGDISISISTTPITSPAKGTKGTVTLSGAIKEFKIGGKEFYLDNICFEHKGKYKSILNKDNILMSTNKVKP